MTPASNLANSTHGAIQLQITTTRASFPVMCPSDIW